MEQSYKEFIAEHGIQDTLFTRTIFNAGYNAGVQNQIDESKCEGL
jgi:hypothetical protein